MDILGIGIPELIFIVLIALIVLGPKDMVAAGRTFGKTLRKIVTSPTWKAVRSTGQELQQLPNRLMREAGLDELDELERDMRDVAQSIDPRRIARSLDEKPKAGNSPAAANRLENGAPPGPDPAPDSSPEKPQA
jgi:sec-independent protein translocase protein TatB